RLPLRHRPGQDLAGRGQRVVRARGDAAAVALLADDPEVTELEARALAHEHVQGREVPVEHLPSVELAQDLEDAGDLAPRDRLPPALARARKVRAQVAVARVLEGQAVEDTPV